ncbi:unnamed protein product [Peniophora sp. CBMAI 1063]|nr:unnamed protein product [Peniophora sp. CBMAI 1063]
MGIFSFLQRWLLYHLTLPLEDFRNIRYFRFCIPWIVKITPRTTSTEAHALRFLHSSGLELPIPRLITAFVHSSTTYTVMARLPGERLVDAMQRETFSREDLDNIVAEVWAVLVKLQTLRQPAYLAGKVMLSASGHDLPEPLSFFEERSGPFSSILELWRYAGSFGSMAEMRQYVAQDLLDALEADPIRYVHPDLRTYNIIVRDGHLSGIIDWEDSGWYPSAWQVHAMRYRRFGCLGEWHKYWKEQHRFSPVAEAAYDASATFLMKSPV